MMYAVLIIVIRMRSAAALSAARTTSTVTASTGAFPMLILGVRQPVSERARSGRPRRGRAEWREIRRFTAEYGAKFPKAVAALTTDQERLLTLFAYPAEHWKHLRTTSPIESTFATVRLRERVTKGAGSQTAGLTMAFTLGANQ